MLEHGCERCGSARVALGDRLEDECLTFEYVGSRFCDGQCTVFLVMGVRGVDS